MDSPAIYLQPFYLPPFSQWLLYTSWQAGVLVCLILLIQKTLGRWIGVRGRYWLWLVLLIRTVTPWAPPSAVSMYNLLPPPRLASDGLAATAQSGNVGPAFAATDGAAITGEYGKAGPAADSVRDTQDVTGLRSQARHWLESPTTALFLLWLAGVCDGLALSMLTPDETVAYGRTIVHQIEQLLTSRPHRMLAALSGDRARVKQRIAMISQFTKGTHRRSPLAIVLIGLLACTGLTNGLPVYKFPVYGPARDVPTTHQDKHANIVRVHIRHRETAKYLVVHGQTLACDVNAPGDAGLWEARFDEDFGDRDDIVYFYSVDACKYLISDKEGNVSVGGLEPNEAARCSVWNCGDGRLWIMPRQCAGSYLCRADQGRVRAEYNRAAPGYWEIDSLWRVKTSNYPEDSSQWHRRFIPGPDWGPPWSLLNRKK